VYCPVLFKDVTWSLAVLLLLLLRSIVHAWSSFICVDAVMQMATIDRFRQTVALLGLSGAGSVACWP